MATLSTRLIGSLVLWLGLATIALGQASGPMQVFDPNAIDDVDMIMFDDPKVAFPPPRLEISGEPIALWKRALDRSNSQLQRVTVDTIAMAHRRGMKGIEALVPELVEILSEPDLPPDLAYALVSALIEFDSRDQAELLLRVARRQGSSVASRVEPALARWQSNLLLTEWLGRIEEPTVHRIELLHAIEGLAALEADEAAGPLSTILTDPYASPSVRMAAGRALGRVQSQGLEGQAEGLAAQARDSVPAGLHAVALLARHDSEAAIECLQGLAVHPSPVVQAGALERLFEIDPQLVSPFAADAIESSDVNVRRIGAKTMVTERDAERVESLSRLLDDVNPALRREMAAALVDLAEQHGMRDQVIEHVSGVLGQTRWRGCEQAALVLVNLDHKPAGSRMVDLLNHERREVMVTVAWGLRRLAVPEHLPAMLDQGKSILNGFRSGNLDLSTGHEVQAAHLFMAFGLMDYQPADELMREYIPKDFSLGDFSRPAAIWALGLLHRGEAPEDLSSQFVQRLNDVDSMEFPETADVRQMSVVSLARMESNSALPEIRKFATLNGGSVGLACLWAIEQMTGERPPVMTPKTVSYHDWFLAPLRKDDRTAGSPTDGDPESPAAAESLDATAVTEELVPAKGSNRVNEPEGDCG